MLGLRWLSQRGDLRAAPLTGGILRREAFHDRSADESARSADERSLSLLHGRFLLPLPLRLRPVRAAVLDAVGRSAEQLHSHQEDEGGDNPHIAPP
jgi:hypothetical protein